MVFDDRKILLSRDRSENSYDIYDGLFNAEEPYSPLFKDFDII